MLKSLWHRDVCCGTASHRGRIRRGTATIEFAICLPVLLILFLGTIDACAVVSLQQSLETSAYEGLRVASIQGSTTDAVVERCGEMLSQRGVANVSVKTDPKEIGFALPGQTIEVALSAPCDGAMTFFGPFYRGKTATARFATVRQITSP